MESWDPAGIVIGTAIPANVNSGLSAVTALIVSGPEPEFV
jgi:hypothetical protein